MTDSTALIFILLFVVALAVLAFSYGRKRPPSSPQTGAPTGAADWTSASAPSRRLSAAEARDLVVSLQHAGAQWPDIVLALNPGDDSRIGQVLQSIRGPHLFAPHTALTVIRHGFDLAIARDPHASHLAGLLEAKESMNKVIRTGD